MLKLYATKQGLLLGHATATGDAEAAAFVAAAVAAAFAVDVSSSCTSYGSVWTLLSPCCTSVSSVAASLHTTPLALAACAFATPLPLLPAPPATLLSTLPIPLSPRPPLRLPPLPLVCVFTGGCGTDMVARGTEGGTAGSGERVVRSWGVAMSCGDTVVVRRGEGVARWVLLLDRVLPPWQSPCRLNTPTTRVTAFTFHTCATRTPRQ